MIQEMAVKKFNDDYPEKSQIVAYRRADRLYLQNFKTDDKVDVRLDAKTSKMIIEITLNEDEYLFIGQTSAFTPKITLFAKPEGK